MVPLKRSLLSVLVLVALGEGLVACGDDDDGSGATGPTATTGAMTDDGSSDHDHGGSPTGTGAPLCAEGDTEVFPAEPAPSADADEVVVSVTEEQAGDITVYSLSESTATDLAGVGSYAVTFRNQGEEMHELAVARIDEDETRTVPELLQAAEGGEDPSTFSTDIAAGSACPGEETRIGVPIDRPGRYVLLCRFPVGSEPGLTQAELDALDAPPHAAQGMVTEVAVP